ncbi:unnamed protein product [Caenorhabditis angaria]|uniref:Cleavage and polyadenylation specificity factor subunit 2 n=1 Tax=Caenorhabditis angaria TaxID=860376 RepID=A0A9P1N5Q9_9PELO|nr:unnamed protein product [Caenorhabditis angaria]
MTSIIKLQVFSGAKDEGPLCYLLQIDGDYILLDCGWDERFDTKYIEELKPFIPKISAVLISHPDILHLGALPYLVGKCGLHAPVYATVPVFKMGQMFIYDWIYSHKDVEDFQHFSLEDLDLAVERVEQVKYNQTVVLKGDSGVNFTALPAGHMLGGSIWRICRVTGEDIIYSVDFNHKKERHLNGCSFENFNRPHLLITGAHHISLPQMRRKDRDELLVNKILRTVRQRGDCMIVIDTAGRILEIAHLLDQLWSNTDAGLSTYNLVMLSHVASSVVQFAKSQLEWMNEKLYRYDSTRSNPFNLRNVHLCHSHDDLMKIRSPRVVLCSNIDMESGFSRELFLEWCTDSRNGVILTGRPSNFTLAAKLVNLAENSADGKLTTDERFLNLTVKKRQPLDGEELIEYRRRKAERDAEETRQKMERARRQAHIMNDESDDSDDEDSLIITSNHQKLGHDQKDDFHNSDVHCFDIMAKWDNQQKQSFFKTTKKSFPIYPYLEEKVRWDEYGEIIKLEEYTVAPLKDIVVKKGKDDQVIVKKESEEDMEHEYNEHDESVEVEEMPTKCVEYKYRVEVVCRVEFIEYEGISDGESTKKLLAGLQPRQIIIVHGSIQDTRELFAYFKDHGVAQGKIDAPAIGQLVDASVESFIYQVALSDALLADIQFKEISEENGLAWIDARVVEKEAIEGLTALSITDQHQHQQSSSDLNNEENGEEPMDQTEQIPTKERIRGNLILDILPNKQIPCHDAVFVNDPKLTDFKNVLTEKGYKAEFLSGTLLINGGTCSIRRCETGYFLLEGALSKDYYKLRHLFYDQFAVL